MILRVGVEHPRTLIREAVVTLLTNKTSAGPRVFDTRFEPYKMAAVPVISVNTLNEQSTLDGAITTPRELTRTLRLEVECWVRDSDTVSVGKAMDRVARDVELAMNAANFPPLGGLASDFVLEGTEMGVLREGDPPLGLVVLTYSVTYRDDVDTTVVVTDLERADFTTTVTGGVEDTAPIEDIVTIQEAAP